MSGKATPVMCVVVLAVGFAGASAAGAPPSARPGAFGVLSDESFWRFHAAWRTPATVRDGKVDLGGGHPIPESGTRWILNSFTEPTPPAPAGWTAPDFDDSGWRRLSEPPFGGYGYGAAAEIHIVCARARFGVTDPARAGPLTLRMTYRGGVVVYVNGQETARGHMPSGKVEPLTLARDYDREAFVGPNGAPLPPPGRGRQPPDSLLKHYQKRFRDLRVDFPAGLLRRGTNVLALELHRAALPSRLGPVMKGSSWNPTVGRNVWGTCGLVGISLTAPSGAGLTANVGAVPPVQVWACDPLVRPGTDLRRADPLEPPRPVRLAAPRNGVSSGQVVVSSARPLGGVSATLGDLKTDSGAALGAGCVEIRYATAGDRVPRLMGRPPGPVQVLPIWLTARIPKGAAPGRYRGTLKITGLDRPTPVAVELTAYGWTLPDLKDYGTSVSLLHCPESTMRHYEVPLWSDRHFKLLERSMALMGYAGNTLLSVSAIGEDVFGDQPMIVFRKERGGYRPDFRFARRYLELYSRHAAPPRQLSVQVWNYSVSRRGFGRDGGKQKWMCKTIKVRLLDGDRLVPAEVPVYTRPGTEATWSAVAAGMKRIVKGLGWGRTRLLWGTGGDNLPNAEIVAFFKKIAPDMHWRVVTHGSSVRKWGQTPEQRTQRGGLVVGYANVVRRNYSRRLLVKDAPIDVLKRDGVTSAPTDYLTMAPLGRIAANYSGTGFLSFDNWSWPTADGKRRSPIRSYASFGNIHPSGGPFVAPGPDGAAPSPQLEAFREGLQITEAILHLHAALADPQSKAAIEAGLADEVKATIQVLMDVMESNRRVRPAGTADVWPVVRRLYRLASEILPDKPA
jgi:hypothetical protein